MRNPAAEPSLVWRILPWLVALIILGVFGAATVFLRGQEAGRRAAEARADAAEAQLAEVQASLTALVQAVASVTAIAEANQPSAQLRRSLALVYDAYKGPTEARLKALGDAFGPSALDVERPEAEHLISGAMHLGGSSPPDITILSTTPTSNGLTEVRTHEVWVYDEVDATNKPTRCVREESEQTYTMRQLPTGLWFVDAIQLVGAPKRTDC